MEQGIGFLYFSPEILVNIISWLPRPSSLFCTCRALHRLSQQPWTQALWLLRHCGQDRALTALSQLPTSQPHSEHSPQHYPQPTPQPHLPHCSGSRMSPPSPAPGPPSQHEHYLHSVAKACLDLGAAPSEALVAWAVTVADMPSLVCLVGPRVPEACLAHAWISNQGARQGHEAALRALAALSPGLRASVAANSMMVWCAAVAGRANLVKWWLGLQQPDGKACLGFLRQALTAAITSSLDEHIIAQVVAELLPSCQPDSMHDNHGMEVGGHPITCCTTYNPSRAVMQALLDGGLRPPPSALQAVVRNLGRGGPHANPAMALWMVQQLVKAGAEVDAMNGAALREAAQRGDALLVKQLLSLGAQATQSTRAAAESCGHTAVLHLLSGAGWHPSSLPQPAQPSTSDVTREVAVSERLHGTTLSGQEPGGAAGPETHATPGAAPRAVPSCTADIATVPATGPAPSVAPGVVGGPAM
ncbi:hypothetical protein V8C86DRAFT_2631904 [Haematococcus lacustris]